MTQPRNRAVGDIVGAGNVAHRLPGVAAAKGLLDLMGSQLRRSGADQLALKLGQLESLCTQLMHRKRR
jgi:hypothetical protein